MAWYRGITKAISSAAGDVAGKAAEVILDRYDVNPAVQDMAVDYVEAGASAVADEVVTAAVDPLGVVEATSNVVEAATKPRRNVFDDKDSGTDIQSLITKAGGGIRSLLDEAQPTLEELGGQLSGAKDDVEQYFREQLQAKTDLDDRVGFIVRSAEFHGKELLDTASAFGDTVNATADALISTAETGVYGAIAGAAKLSDYIVAGDPSETGADVSLLGIPKAVFGGMYLALDEVETGLRLLEESGADPVGDPESLRRRIEQVQKMKEWSLGNWQSVREGQYKYLEDSAELQQWALDLGYESQLDMLDDFGRAGENVYKTLGGIGTNVTTPLVVAQGALSDSDKRLELSDLLQERGDITDDWDSEGLLGAALAGAGLVAKPIVGAGGVAASRLLRYAKSADTIGDSISEYLNRV